jgi:hypothetical protein
VLVGGARYVRRRPGRGRQDQKYRDIFVLENCHRLARDLPRAAGCSPPEPALAAGLAARELYEDRLRDYVAWIAECQLGVLLKFKRALDAQVLCSRCSPLGVGSPPASLRSSLRLLLA